MNELSTNKYTTKRKIQIRRGWTYTFPDKYLFASSVVQDVAFTVAEHVLLEWVFIRHHTARHGAGSIGNLESRER